MYTKILLIALLIITFNQVRCQESTFNNSESFIFKRKYIDNPFIFSKVGKNQFEIRRSDREIEFTDDDKENNRFSFVLGIGASYLTTKLYQNPSIDVSSNAVVIEHAQQIKTNLTFGIVYTPYLKTISYRNGQSETMPHGISFATFINPIALTKVTENQSFFNMTDFGIGVGYKFAGNVMIMGTAEFFGVRQPKEWFINKYQLNDKQYVVNGSAQLSFDVNDNNIFRTKMVSSFGFKVCYTFDIVKNFNSSYN